MEAFLEITKSLDTLIVGADFVEILRYLFQVDIEQHESSVQV